MTRPLPPAHAAFLARLDALTRADARLLGVAVSGSYVTGDLDEFSDLDFQVVVADEAYASLLADRLTFAAGLGELLAAFTGEHVGEPRLLICLYGDPLLHVDLKFVSLAAFATDRVEDPAVLWERGDLLSAAIAANPCAYPPFDPQWVEDRFWVWLHYGASKLGRGELFEAIETLSFMRERALAPLAKALGGKPPRGSRFLEREAPAYLGGFATTLAASQDPAAIQRALHAVAALYQRLRDDLGAPALVRRQAAEAATVAYLADVAGGRSRPAPH